MSDAWVQIFMNPRFRKGWENVRNGVAPSELERDDIVHIFGRLMAAETGWPLPRYSEHMTYEMQEAIAKCDAFMKQMTTAQLLQGIDAKSKEVKAEVPFPGQMLEELREGGDLSQLMGMYGVKQGDSNDE